MRLLIENNFFEPNKSDIIGGGGEGDVYKLDELLAAKVYTQPNDDRRQKVLALCNSYFNNIHQFGGVAYAFPQNPVYENEERFDLIIGFSMKYFKDCPDLYDVQYDLNSNQFIQDRSITFTDENAINLIYKIFELADRLHKARIILGDVSPENMLYDPKSDSPVFLDLDAVQIGPFSCPMYKPDYIDPLIELQGRNLSDRYLFSSESDVFSLACVAYEFLVGVHPYFVYIDPEADIPDKKRKGINSLKCFVHGDSYLSAMGIKYLDNNQNRIIKQRLEALRQVDQRLFDFFVSVFVMNHRSNLILWLPRTDPRHPAYDLVSKKVSKKGSKGQIDQSSQNLPNARFDKVLRSISQSKSRPTQAGSVKKGSEDGFSVPDSGFSGILDSISRPSVSVSPTVGLKGMGSVKPLTDKHLKHEDPKEFEQFLNSYNIGVSDMVRGY